MCRLHAKVAECDYKEYIIELMNQFICGLDDEGMTSEILWEVSALQDMDDATSKRVMSLAQRVEALRVQKEALNYIKEVKQFDSVKC